jgi:hypothetical protein
MPRHPTLGKEPAVTKSVRLDAKTAEAIEDLGGGNFSIGARLLLKRGLRQLRHPSHRRHRRRLTRLSPRRQRNSCFR